MNTSSISIEKTSITGVILAGGQARRMDGQDKGLIPLSGKAMIEYVIEAIEPQVKSVIINANRNLSDYMQYGLPVIPDSISGYKGPLAGMASCLRVIETEFMLTVPCDSPFVPDDLATRLYTQLQKQQADISVAHDGKRMQPVFVLLKTALYDSMLDFLNRDERKIDKWFAQHNTITTDFSDKPQTFININTPEDISHIEAELIKA